MTRNCEQDFAEFLNDTLQCEQRSKKSNKLGALIYNIEDLVRSLKFEETAQSK